MKDKIKLAVIGCGVWGQAHAEVFARHRFPTSRRLKSSDPHVPRAEGRPYCGVWPCPPPWLRHPPTRLFCIKSCKHFLQVRQNLSQSS